MDRIETLRVERNREEKGFFEFAPFSSAFRSEEKCSNLLTFYTGGGTLEGA